MKMLKEKKQDEKNLPEVKEKEDIKEVKQEEII